MTEEIIKEATRLKTILFLKNYNGWRRGSDVPQPHPEDIGKALDEAIRLLQDDK